MSLVPGTLLDLRSNDLTAKNVEADFVSTFDELRKERMTGRVRRIIPHIDNDIAPTPMVPATTEKRIFKVAPVSAESRNIYSSVPQEFEHSQFVRCVFNCLASVDCDGRIIAAT